MAGPLVWLPSLAPGKLYRVIPEHRFPAGAVEFADVRVRVVVVGFVGEVVAGIKRWLVFKPRGIRNNDSESN